MSDEYYDDDEEIYDDEEWEYFEEEEGVSFRERVSIWDIIKLLLLFVWFAGFFLFFRFWNDIASFLAFGGEAELGQSRLIYVTLLLFPFLAVLFLTGLVKTSRKIFIPPKEAAIED